MADKQVPPLDEKTLVQVAAAVQDAMRAGRSPAEVLNERGLILTKARQELYAVAGLERFRAMLHLWLPHEMLRKVNRTGDGTPADMYEAVILFTDEMISMLKERGL